MHRLITVLILIAGSSSLLFSQTLTGVVCDSTTKIPIAYAAVYLDGTAIHTTTNLKGEFVLNVGKRLNTNLIISHVAYEQKVITNPFSVSPNEIFLSEKEYLLPEVYVVADRFTKKQKLEIFKKYFLGEDRSAKQCKILNEDDIQFSYSQEDKTLLAFCPKPVQIINTYLGYSLEFNLIEFKVSFRDNTINSSSVARSLFLGTSLFVDLVPDSKRLKKRRDDTYKESINSFFKNLADGTLKESTWSVFNRSYEVEADRYFGVKDTLSMKLVSILPNTNINRFMYGINEPVAGSIAVLYNNKKQQSTIVFFTESLWVDEYGNISDLDKILYSGNFSRQRISKMLPLDFSL